MGQHWPNVGRHPNISAHIITAGLPTHLASGFHTEAKTWNALVELSQLVKDTCVCPGFLDLLSPG